MDNTPDDAGQVAAQAHAIEVGLEALSALMDGQAGAAVLAGVSAAYAEHGPVRQAWAQYQWVGDVLREGHHALPAADPVFVQGVMGRLAREGAGLAHLAPARLDRPQPVTPAATRPAVPAHSAANDAAFHWPRVVGLASVVALAVGGWQLWGSSTGQPLDQTPRLAQVEQAAAPATGVAWNDHAGRLQPVQTERGVFMRDPQLQALLAEHRDNGGLNALQVPAGFMRNAAYAQSDR